MKITIKKTDLKEVFAIHKKIPEFTPNPPKTLKEFEDEIKDKKYLVLTAYCDGKMAGYSIGYDKFSDRSFYIWLCGVIPEYRKQGIFSSLILYQEKWSNQNGYKSIKVKTWNRRVQMRIALDKLDYYLVGFEEKPDVLDNRLIYEKIL